MKLSHFLLSLGAVAALSACNSKQENAASNAPLKITPIAPPKGGDWTQTVSMTPQGGFVMGNPDAKVKLIEIGALTCPHCREFDEKGVPTLVDSYVKSGQVSWEFRTYLLHGLDLPAALIARCNGANSFFPLARALYHDQETWVGKAMAVPQAQMDQLQTLPVNQQFVTLAKLVGLPDWAAARGVPQAKSNQCLSDQNAINQLVQQTSDVSTQYPDFPGTPTFILNGKMLEKTATWDTLEPKLREAVS